MKIISKILIGLIAVFLISGCSVILFSSLEPLAWDPPEKPILTGVIAENELLNTTEWIDLKGWYGPEDIASDSEGNLYCGAHVSKTDFTDGRILKVDSTGEVSVFCNTGSWITGMHFDSEDNLIACDIERGLIRVNKSGEITTLASEDENGKPFVLPNDVDIAKDGMIYFSNTSSRTPFSLGNVKKLILELQPDGGLYRYDPKSEIVETLIDSSFFGNGVAVSENDEFVLMANTAKYNVLRYWLKGENKGKTDIFLENLPGFPNGISRREDGSFWIGFSTKRNDDVDKIHPSPKLKKLVYALPNWMQPKADSYGMIMNVSRTGEILKTYFDTTGKFVSEASSVEERDGYLYLGGDLTDHIGKFKIE